ncbi:PIN domain-containing protein [Candidatus Gottesmanbacteria bacterium]|nr:PIN domain-containing protein [Candidatus Gottesmanbacteria bacterium]
MNILYSPTLIPTLEGKYLLLDTNIFIDSYIKPHLFTSFFNDLKKADITLTTIDLVKCEFLKGSPTEEKYNEREIFITDITNNTILPITKETYELAYNLIKLYKVEGSAVKITDLFLGACLMQYKKNIFLLTRDTTDFIQRIFELSFIVNVPHTKGILTYGIYQYIK